MSTPLAADAAAAGTFDLLPGHPVARMGYGTMQLQRGEATPHARSEDLDVLRRTREVGIDHYDTAPFYARGRVMDVMQEGLAPYDGVTIVSKCGLVNNASGAFVPAQRPEQIREQIERSLRALDIDRIDVVNLRRLDTGRRRAEGDQLVDLGSQLAELVALRDEGKIAGIGLSNVSLEQCEQAEPVGIACVQNAYNVLMRQDEPIVDWCRERTIAYVPFFPLGSGAPQFPKVRENPAVVAVAERLGATPAQVGLAWLLQHSPTILLIPGTASVAHLNENVGAASLRLDPDAIAELDAL